MTALPPRIVVSLPGRSVQEVAAQIAAARDGGADLAEVRFDRWDPSERLRAAELFPAALPLLATLRSRAEGGEGPDAPEARTPELQRLVRLPFEGIDLEVRRDAAFLRQLPPEAPHLRFLSAHLAEDASPRDVAELLRGEPSPDAVRKVVLPATVHAVLRELLPVLPAAGDGPRILLTTGPSGALLRAWSARLDYPFVFASLPRSRSSDPPVEPSQVPVDRLRPFLDAGAGAPIFALLGRPVAHSQSPYLHARWMRAVGHAGLYIPLDIQSESEFVEALPALAEGGFLGLNVTHPWKSVALASASRVGRAAELCAVANCLTLRGEEVEADNTDLVAILRRLEELRSGGSWDGQELAVVGAGGAAAATLAAARELGVRAAVVARDPDRSGAVAARFAADRLEESELRPFPLVVHATTVGRSAGDSLEIPLDRLLAPGAHLLDWVYAPASPAVRATAERARATYEDGWRLLVYQAAASFGLWWGTEPPADELAATLTEGPCAA